MGPLLAYDAAGNVVATLDYLTARDAAGTVVGLIDFEAHEAAGGKLRDIWQVNGAGGSGTWPEWLGGRAHDFGIEIGPDGRIGALVHRTSGYRRERAAVEAAIAAAPTLRNGARDLRGIVGGPQRPLVLDDKGQTVPRSASMATPAPLPIIGRVPSP